MKDGAGGAAIEKCVRLKPQMYSFFVDDNSQHKNRKSVNKNLVVTASQNEQKDFVLNNISLRHSMNKIQSKNNEIRTYQINKFFYQALMIKYIS